MKFFGNNIFIKILETSDAEAQLQLEINNRDFFQTYTPLKNDEFYTFEQQLERIKQSNLEKDLDQKYSFGIFLNETEELIGNVTLSEVLRALCKVVSSAITSTSRTMAKGI